MKTTAALIAALALTAATTSVSATESILITKADGITSAIANDDFGQFTFSDDQTVMTATSADGVELTFPVDSITELSFADIEKVITIEYNGTDATIVNPYAFEGIYIYKDGADVTVNSEYDSEVEYQLSGTTTDGCFKIYSSKKFILTLNGVSITNGSGAAINCQSSKKMTLQLTDGTTNTLCDATKYTTVGSEDMKGTVFSEGKINITGNGSLTVTGLKKHGIVCDDELIVDGGTITLTDVASDGFHSKDLFQLNDGTITIAASSDGIDGDEGPVEINGGTLIISVTEDTTKGIKSDSAIVITDGVITITTSGGVEVSDGDPSYCTAIKCDQTVTMTGGELTITCTGEAGKGISADGNVEISGGTVTITTSGAGATYTDSSNATDSYCAHCIKADEDIYLTGGTITMKSTGKGGKCASADGDVVIDGSTTSSDSSSDDDDDDDSSSDSSDSITIYVSGSSSYYMYVWDPTTDTAILNSWPGNQFSSLSSTTVDGTTYYYYTFTGYSSLGVIFNTGNGGNQTGDMTVTATTYFSYSGGSSATIVSGGSSSDSSSSDGITVYVSGSSSYYMYAWYDGVESVIGTWPGTQFSALSSTTVSGTTYYYYTFTEGSPVYVIFNTGYSGNQTGTITVTSDTYFSYSGGTSASTVSVSSAAQAKSASVKATSSSDLVITATTTGAQFLVSGSGENADYCNPKAFKAEGDLTVNGGTITISTSQDGGEGLESKSTLTINGGTLYITTYDDALNASSLINLNGGTLYAYSSGNDGIDSNGDMVMTGGTVIAVGITTPEGGMDADEGTFYITGGILIALGGTNTSPSASKSTQRSVIYSPSSSVSANQVLHIQDSSGNDLMTFTSPQSYSSGGAELLFSSPDLTTSTTYYIYTGGSVSGGTTFGGYTTGGTYSGGSQKASFTCSSMVTTVTESSSNGPGSNSNSNGPGSSNSPF